MIALIQRVTEAHVDVDSEVVGRIGAGLLALVAIERGDAEPQVNACSNACSVIGSSPTRRDA